MQGIVRGMQGAAWLTMHILAESLNNPDLPVLIRIFSEACMDVDSDTNR